MTIDQLRTLFVASLQSLHIPSRVQPFAPFNSWSVYLESEAFPGGSNVYVVMPPKNTRTSKLDQLLSRMKQFSPEPLGGHLENVRIPEFQPSNRRRFAIVFDSI